MLSCISSSYICLDSRAWIDGILGCVVIRRVKSHFPRKTQVSMVNQLVTWTANMKFSFGSSIKRVDSFYGHFNPPTSLVNNFTYQGLYLIWTFVHPPPSSISTWFMDDPFMFGVWMTFRTICLRQKFFAFHLTKVIEWKIIRWLI